MQNEKTLQQMIKQYEAEMPVEIMNLIKSFDWKKEVRTIVNQNQLMIDVGADLEESIYLMLLGVVQGADLYERLLEVHELPEDTAKKIIQEIEMQIFNPLHKKLIELDEKEKREDTYKNTTASAIPRDEILAEIEKESEPLIRINVAATQEKKSPTLGNMDGITKPFTLSPEKNVQVEKEQLTTSIPQVAATPIAAPVPVAPMQSVQPIEGVQQDPVASALTKPTVTQTPKPLAADPYREPIE